MFLDALIFFLSKITFFAGTVIGNTSFPKPLSKEEERIAGERMKAGDEESRERLITHNMRLVAHVVKKYTGAAETDDLISVGSIGLIKAINTFSPEKGTSLATYTARCIENEILMLLRANKKYKSEISILTPVGEDKEGNELTIQDLLPDAEDSVFHKVDNGIEREKFLKFLKENLTEREYTVLCLRFGLKGGKCYAQREVAKFLKISRSYISRIEKKALEKLKDTGKNGHFYC